MSEYSTYRNGRGKFRKSREGFTRRCAIGQADVGIPYASGGGFTANLPPLREGMLTGTPGVAR